MPSHRLALVLVCLSLTGPVGAYAQTVTVFRDGQSPDAGYAGTRNVTIERGDQRPTGATTNYDSADGWAWGTKSIDTLMRWDLSGVPAATTVTAAELQLTMVDGTSASYELYECTQPWVASEATFRDYAAGKAWASAGATGAADHASASLGVLTGATGTVRVVLNASGVAAVQAWVSGARANHGFIAQNRTPSDYAWWRSAQHPVPAERPLLRLTHAGGTIELQNGLLPAPSYLGNTDVPIANNTPPDRTSLWLDGGGGGSDASLLISFELSGLPRAIRVLGAQLQFRATGSSDDAYRIYEALRPWNENASWATFDGSSPWETQGAAGASDRGSVVLGRLGPAASSGPASFTLEEPALRLIEDWAAGRRVNRGFLVQDYTLTDGLDFEARSDSTVVDRPALVVTWVESDGGVPNGQGPSVTLSPDAVEVRPGQAVTLEAKSSASGPLTYRWSQPEGPHGVRLTAEPVQTFTTHEPGVYVFRVTAADASQNVSFPAEARVTVSGAPYRPPERLGCSSAGGLGALGALALLALRRRPTWAR